MVWSGKVNLVTINGTTQLTQRTTARRQQPGHRPLWHFYQHAKGNE